MLFIGTTYGASGDQSPSIMLFDTQLDSIDPLAIMDLDTAAQVLRKARTVLGAKGQANAVRGKNGSNYYLTSFKYKSRVTISTDIPSLAEHARHIGPSLAGCASDGTKTQFTGSSTGLPDSFIVPEFFPNTPTLYLPEISGRSRSGGYTYRSTITTYTGHRLVDGTGIQLNFSISGTFGDFAAKPSLGISRDTELVMNSLGLNSSNDTYVSPANASGDGLAYFTGVVRADEQVNIDFGLAFMPDGLWKFDQSDFEFEQNLVPGTRPKVIRFRTDIFEV